MSKKALIIVDHGSKVEDANDMLIEIADLVRENGKNGFDIIAYSHMELAEPTISQAFDKCVSEGATHIVIHPYFLAPGRHSTQDIPRMVKEAAAQYENVTYQVTEPLGIHDKIIEVVLERANQ